MKKVFFLVLVLITTIACKNNKKIETKVKQESEKVILETGCFEFSNNGNIIHMKITKITENVSANLNIHYSEKDASQGTFEGKLYGDKLIGVYIFNSEGTESSRELAFWVKNNQLIEGYGELNENGTSFIDRDAIKYTSTMPLTKVKCAK
ncbi:hypothetical protein CW731_05205 [Polaribacter sp. ALD11]|uniref:hypothetical protein n=1 Tax=Polaribacter sp. ALD11 TaxID=2058137 RepID=UPI000C31544F|nr:hypothetical protein [Polaribacter sp. ALD11]AUC84727.1 hypothetical protein CW731_05205 [Polaribacter sp. ALD11]